MGRSSQASRVGAAAAALCLPLFLAAFLAGCAGSSVSDPDTDAMVETAVSTAGISVEEVAAVVGGRIVTQEQVDDAIAANRVRLGCEDDQDWQRYLDNSGLTEWDARAAAIKTIVDDILVELAAADLGVDVDAELAQRMNALENLYPSHQAFVEAIEDKGYTERTYTLAVGNNLRWNALRAAVVGDPQPTEEQVRQYAVVVAPTLVGRRSSHILFSSGDYALALQVLDLARQGADFAELAKAYSIDATASNGGDVGWDSLNTFVPAYQAALDQLEPGELSGIVRTSFGYHIILCTDKYDAPTDADGNIDIDAIPQDLMNAIVRSMNQSLVTQAFDAYIANLEATATIAVFNEQGVQVSPAEVGLAVETTDKGVDVGEVIDEAQSQVQTAVEQGASVVKVSATLLGQGGDSADTPVETEPAGPVETPAFDPVDATASNPANPTLPEPPAEA